MEEIQQQNLKSQIVDAARALLLSEGYRNLSLRKIARKINISATSIYLHFEGKDDLLHTLIEEAIEQLNNELEQALTPGDHPVEKLEALARTYVSFGLAHPAQYQTIYLVSSDEMARYPKEKFRKARRGYQLVIDVLQEGIMHEHKPRVAAYTFWAQLHGVMSVVLSERLDTRIDQNEFIEEAINHIISNYKQRTSIEPKPG